MMKAMWTMVLVGALAPAAWAQEVGDRAEVVEATPTVRFLGESVPGPELREGQVVLVVAVEGAQARVAAGERFGWVDRARLRLPAELPTLPPLGD